MILLCLFMISCAILIFFEYQNAKKRKQEKLAFCKWKNQVLTLLEKISNKY